MSSRTDRDPGLPTLDPEFLARVRLLELRTRRQVTGALSGAYRSSFRGSGVEFDEVRPYQPGDDVRRIDWRVTARTGEPHLKTYREERQLRVRLVVDTSRSMDFGSVADTKRETAAAAAALLAVAASAQRDPVALDLFDAEPGLHLPPSAERAVHLRVLKAVAEAESRPGGGAGLVAALERVERTQARHSLVVVLSDFDVGEDWVKPARRLAAHHDVVLARVTDPFERELPRVGVLRLRDLEGGASGAGGEREVDTDSRAVRAAWAADAAARREAFLRAAARARADAIELSTDASPADPLIALFLRRARMGGAVR